MYILYGGDFTRAPLVQWVLEEGKIEYELRKVDILNGEHRSAEFLAINPAGLVPVLMTPEGDALYEVAALMLYLADRHQLTELAPTSTDPDRGHFLSAIFHVAGDIQSEMKRFHFPHRFSLRRQRRNSGFGKVACSEPIERDEHQTGSKRSLRLGNSIFPCGFLSEFLGRIPRPQSRVHAVSVDCQAL